MAVHGGAAPPCGVHEGYRATVAALAANQAVLRGGRVEMTYER